jgi:hypothetical protein
VLAFFTASEAGVPAVTIISTLAAISSVMRMGKRSYLPSAQRNTMPMSVRSLCKALFGLAPLAQDHEVVGVGHDPRAEALLQPELLPSPHEPAHVEIGQQG